MITAELEKQCMSSYRGSQHVLQFLNGCFQNVQ